MPSCAPWRTAGFRLCVGAGCLGYCTVFPSSWLCLQHFRCTSTTNVSFAHTLLKGTVWKQRSAFSSPRSNMFEPSLHEKMTIRRKTLSLLRLTSFVPTSPSPGTLRLETNTKVGELDWENETTAVNKLLTRFKSASLQKAVSTSSSDFNDFKHELEMIRFESFVFPSMACLCSAYQTPQG